MFLRPLQEWRSRRAQTPAYRAARRIVIGSAQLPRPGDWLLTDQPMLDVTRRGDFLRYWQPETLEAFLAEHVWEHLTPQQAALGIRNCFAFLRPGGRLRLAVPDGHFPDPAYQEYVRPGGTGPGADDHQVLWTCTTLPALLREAGFEACLLEWWDAEGRFHAEPWSDDDGYVKRSQKHDPRNAGGTLRYTSLIVDGIKPAAHA